MEDGETRGERDVIYSADRRVRSPRFIKHGAVAPASAACCAQTKQGAVCACTYDFTLACAVSCSQRVLAA